MSDDELRFEKIESKLAWAEDTLEALEHAVFRQGQTLDRMQAALQQISAQLAQLQDSGGAGGGDAHTELPPHY